MRLPAFLRYLPARLSPVTNPIVWIPVLALGLGSVFAWEYHNHPEWLELSEPVPEDSAGTLGLTPEEQGQIAELDTLDVLLNDPNLNTPGLSVASGPLEQVATGTQTEGETPEAVSRPPFSEYLDQYSLLGTRTGSQPANPTAVQTPNTDRLRLRTGSLNNTSDFTGASPLGNSSLLGLSQGLGTASNSVPESALARAIQQMTVATNSAVPTDSSASSAAPVQSSQSPPNSSATSASPVPTFPTSQSGVARGTLPGNANVPFIQTTPGMSPPPGTTGYTPPASLNLNTFNRSLNRTATFPTSIPATTPTFGLRQPQTSGAVLPNPNSFQTQTTQPSPVVDNRPTNLNQNSPTNAWDTYWGGY